MRNARKFLYVACFCGALFGCGGGGSGGSIGMSADNGDGTRVTTILPPSDGVNYRTSEFHGNFNGVSGLSAINADAAYQRRVFGQGVTVGVIDSGVRTTHQELDGNVVAGRDFVFPGRAIADPDGHGTAVAAVIAGERDGTSMHGVAPSARIMPLKIADDSGRLVGNWRDAISHAASNNVRIVNNSFGDVGEEIIGDYGIGTPNQGTYRAEVPFLRGFLNDNRRRLAQDVADRVRNRDIAVVWAAGNGGWNADTGRIRLYRCTPGLQRSPQNCQGSPISVTRNQFLTDFNHLNHFDDDGNVVQGAGFLSDTDGSDVPDLSSYYSSLPLWAVNGIDGILNDFSNGIISEAEFGRRLEADPNFVSMANQWLAVVATDSNNQIASFSNGCGLAAIWCVAAPGVNVYTADADSDSDYQNINGTSFAAPHAAGALALLASAAPELRMSVVRAVLLATATPRGNRRNSDDPPDETYGWGLVNVAAGISLVAGLQTPSGVLLSDMREGMPAEFSHLRGRLDGVSVAVEIVDGAYHNVALSEFARGGGGKNSHLGDAAKGMLSADYAAGESFRFWGGLNYDDSRSSFIGESDSVFSAANASDTNGWIRWTTADYGGLSAFGEWSHTQIDAEYDSAAFISGIENARADGWTAGFRYADLFMHNDALQISARQESRFSGGEMVISHSVAAGDFYRAFLGQESQTLRTETARIPIKEAAETIWAAGYSQRTDSGEKWSAALEWNAATNAKGFSFAAEIDL